jgi:hypothetical protein
MKNLGSRIALVLLWVGLVAGMHRLDNWLHPTPPHLNLDNSIYSNLEAFDKMGKPSDKFQLNYEFLRTAPKPFSQR